MNKIFIGIFVFGLMFGLVGCRINMHEHKFVEGICECGEKDPNYEPPHEHKFVEGICECGENVIKYIINIWVNKINTESLKEITSDDVEILHYFGEYNGCQVAIVKGDCKSIITHRVQIEDIVFIYKLEQISVYKNNKYYVIEEAYDLKLITYEQVLEIYNLYELYNK